MSPFLMLLVVILPFAVPVLGAVLTVLVKGAFEKMPSAVRSQVSEFVTTAVNAVEQASGPNATDSEKKAKAISFVEAQLQHFGFKVPLAVIDPMIEEAVLLVNQAKSAPVVELAPAK